MVHRDGGRTWRPVGPADPSGVAVGAATVWLLAGPLPRPRLYRAAIGSPDFQYLGYAPGRIGQLTASGQLVYVEGPQGAGPAATSLAVDGPGGYRPLRGFPCTTPNAYTPDGPLAVSPSGGVFVDCVGMQPATGAYTNTAWTSDDNGQTWQRQPPPPPGNVTAAATTGSALFVFDGELLVDRGTGWTVALRPPVRPGSSFASLNAPPDLGCPDATHCFLLTTTGVLFLSADGGRTWAKVRP